MVAGNLVNKINSPINNDTDKYSLLIYFGVISIALFITLVIHDFMYAGKCGSFWSLIILFWPVFICENKLDINNPILWVIGPFIYLLVCLFISFLMYYFVKVCRRAQGNSLANSGISVTDRQEGQNGGW